MLENRRGGMVGEQAQGGGERSGWGRGRGPSRVGLQRHRVRCLDGLGNRSGGKTPGTVYVPDAKAAR
jgi:hypothetical protein